MNDMRIAYEVARYKAVRDQLLADNGDEIDEQTLADTTEGLTDLHELLAAIVRGALDDEAMIEMLKDRIKELYKRIDRYEQRHDRRRRIVLEAMMDANINKLAMADFTASVRQAPPHVVVTDEAQIPDSFWRIERHINKAGLRVALKDGPVDGAALSNPGMTLSVRTK